MKNEIFGSGRMNLDNLPVTIDEQARYFGERVGCPVVPALIKGRGPEAMAKRYGEILFYYGYILKVISSLRPDIAKQISEPVARDDSENLVDFDDEWIPPWNKDIIPGTETPWGFALPRLMISYATDSHGFDEPRVDSWVRALTILDKVVEELKNDDKANELMVKFAESLVSAGASAEIILKRTISAGKMRQDSMEKRFREIIKVMSQHAPVLWETYKNLDADRRDELGIANLK